MEAVGAVNWTLTIWMTGIFECANVKQMCCWCSQTICNYSLSVRGWAMGRRKEKPETSGRRDMNSYAGKELHVCTGEEEACSR